MALPIVEQLRFTRSEWLRGLQAVTAEEAARKFDTINTIAWMVGHLAAQEQFYWVRVPQEKIVSEAVVLCASGKPESNPPLAEMWDGWHTVTAAADVYLDALTEEMLPTHLEFNGKPMPENIGTMLTRNIYHYWFHLGEAQAIRQLLGHTDLPAFVGAFGEKAPY